MTTGNIFGQYHSEVYMYIIDIDPLAFSLGDITYEPQLK